MVTVAGAKPPGPKKLSGNLGKSCTYGSKSLGVMWGGEDGIIEKVEKNSVRNLFVELVVWDVPVQYQV